MAAKLLIPKGKFKTELILRIAEGNVILELASKPSTLEGFERHEKNFRIWDDYNREWLEQSFTVATSEYAKQYKTFKTTLEKARFIQLGHSSSDENYRRAFLAKDIATKVEHLESLLSRIDLIQQEIQETPNATASTNHRPLAHLHSTIQHVAGTLYATGHYRQALLDAFIAVDNAVQAKSQLPHNGTRLMEVAFSPGNPALKIGDSPDEQQGFMALFRGAMLAIRNPKAHSLNGTHDAQRALEWLAFASVLLRNLDDATLIPSPTAQP